MEISKELQNFLNDNNVLDLIAQQDWAKLFSMQTLSRSAMNCSQLHSVLLNSGIASTQEILDILGYVPDGFFSRFDNLTSIKLPHNITRIGDVAFWGCKSLAIITIPDSVTSIGNSAFSYCKSLASITIPDSVTSIGRSAFFDCSSLTSITIPNSVTSIGRSAFFDCSSLTSITIPNSVTSIGKYTFQGCWKLETIVFKGTEEQWDQIGNEIDWRECENEVKIIFK